MSDNTYRVHGITFFIPEQHLERPSAVAVRSNQLWEPQTIGVIIGAALRFPNSMVITAGGSYGDTFIPVAKAGIEVLAAEPDPVLHLSGKLNAKNNGVDSMIVFEQCALSSIPAEDVPFDNSISGEGHLVLSPSGGGTIEVEVETIDRLMDISWHNPEQRVSVIHLDVEGHEGEALIGATHTIKRWLPLLITETDLAGDALSMISDLGYSRFHVVEGNRIYVPNRVVLLS